MYLQLSENSLIDLFPANHRTSGKLQGEFKCNAGQIQIVTQFVIYSKNITP